MIEVTSTQFEAAIARAAERLVSIRHASDGAFITTPSMYPSGGAVVVWIDRAPPHFMVTDYGFGFRECAIMGANRTQFLNRASPIAEAAGVQMSPDGAFQAVVSEGQLEGAIKTIAGCSQEVAIKFAHRIFQRQRADVGTLVHEKLIRLFGEPCVSKDIEFRGASQSPWRIDVAVKLGDEFALFDTVTPWAQSVAFTLAKFGDIRLLENAPPRTAVLASKAGFGSWMTALAQNGHILQASAADDAYARAAAIQ